MALGLKLPERKEPAILQPGDTENQLVQGYRKETEDVIGRTAPIRSEMQRVGGEMAAIEAPRPPKLQEVPTFQPREQDSGEMLNFAGIAMALAGIATKAVRGDITLALTAASGAMNGFKEGHLQQSELDIKNFNTKMKSVVESNASQLASYDRVMQDRKLTLGQKQQQMTVLAHQYQDEMAISALRKGDLKFLLERQDKIRNANNSLETKLAQINTQFQGQMMRMEMQLLRQNAANSGAQGGGGGLTPEAIDMLAKEAIKDKGVLANLGRGVQGARDLRAITNKMAEIAASEGGPGMAARRQEFRADSNSLNKLTMQYDAITAFEKTAIRNGKVLVDLADKVDVTGMPVLERWIRAGRRSVSGDPDVSMFNTQMTLFRAEAARILTNPNLTGTLTVHAQQEAEGFLNGSDSAAQIDKVVNLLERDFKAREVTITQQMDAIRDRMTKGYGAGGAAGGAAPQAPQAPKDGDKATSKSGKPIVFRGGQWQYLQ